MSDIRQRINDAAGAKHLLSKSLLGLDWFDTESQARRVIESMVGQANYAVKLQADLTAAEETIRVLESKRPHWAKGFTSDSIAAQVQSSALSQIWELLGVEDQTACVEKLCSMLTPLTGEPPQRQTHCTVTYGNDQYVDGWNDACEAWEVFAAGLQAEISRLDRESQNLSDQLGRCDRDRRESQSELTKARELLNTAMNILGWDENGTPAVNCAVDIQTFLAHQSAPAAKDAE